MNYNMNTKGEEKASHSSVLLNCYMNRQICSRIKSYSVPHLNKNMYYAARMWSFYFIRNLWTIPTFTALKAKEQMDSEMHQWWWSTSQVPGLSGARNEATMRKTEETGIVPRQIWQQIAAASHHFIPGGQTAAWQVLRRSMFTISKTNAQTEKTLYHPAVAPNASTTPEKCSNEWRRDHNLNSRATENARSVLVSCRLSRKTKKLNYAKHADYFEDGKVSGSSVQRWG